MGLNPKRFMVLCVQRSDYASRIERTDFTAVNGPMMEAEAESTAKTYADADVKSGRDDLNLVVEIKSIHEARKTIIRREP